RSDTLHHRQRRLHPQSRRGARHLAQHCDDPTEAPGLVVPRLRLDPSRRHLCRMVATSIVQVRAGELTLEVAPWLGGAVTAFRLGEIELLRPTPRAAIEQGLVRQTGAFPLVPYS